MENQAIDVRRGWTSASNAAADRLCPGRHAAQAGLREDSESDDAKFGRVIHDALCRGDDSGLTSHQVSVYEQCLAIKDRLLEKVFGGDAPNVKIIKERRFWVKVPADPTNPSAALYEHSAQIDWVGRMGNRLLIIEWKTLPGDVPDSPSNEQLRDQSVLAAKTLIAGEVVCAVVQPMVTHDPEVCVYSSDDIRRAEREMFDRVRASNSPNARRIANAVSCKFCLAKATCIEHQQWAGAQLPHTASIIDVPVASWTPEQRARFCSMRGVAQAWLDNCENEMRKLLEQDPNAIPGFTLKPNSPMNPVTDPNELFGRVINEYKESIPQEVLVSEFMKCVEISKGNFEDMIRKVSNTKGNKLKAILNRLLDGTTTEKPRRPSIAAVK